MDAGLGVFRMPYEISKSNSRKDKIKALTYCDEHRLGEEFTHLQELLYDDQEVRMRRIVANSGVEVELLRKMLKDKDPTVLMFLILRNSRLETKGLFTAEVIRTTYQYANKFRVKRKLGKGSYNYFVGLLAKLNIPWSWRKLRLN